MVGVSVQKSASRSGTITVHLRLTLAVAKHHDIRINVQYFRVADAKQLSCLLY